ncbi:tether containing UBX domain for GLUT4 [Scaptodrosophila lebanonensis]|uniref:Tether containing UBX domain for GLUT4 n=1 Tax=Drosophila lebanonensis TaxID=7225 RepID=A0A6J2SY35_DROLE|nr:tether containing UBX domain for GLUT4 [Scaptodrosophila lebanonensis]XP_030369492.1 tether containing UBX domain for GLUT4 [Scaptodrosophila lebanonensis]
MDKRVTVLLPNGRRQNVNVSPNMTLLEILETASAKHGFDSEEHCLKFHNKEVSLTQQFRFSGLPNNCVLEMEPTEKRRTVGNVVVCIQLSDGSREQGEFGPGSTLWQVVLNLCSAQMDSYESPVIIYMRSEVIGKEQMQQTTLKSLGILEGRVMMRLIDKKPEELRVQANVYKPPVVESKPRVDDDQPSTSRSVMGGGGGFALTSNMVKSLKRTAPEGNSAVDPNTNDNQKNESVDEPERPKADWGSGSGYSMHQPKQSELDDDQEEVSDQAPPEVNVIGPRHAVLFSLDASKKQSDELPDSFFDLTVNDLKMVLRDLKRTSSGNEDAPLLTAKLRELERQKTMLTKLNQYKDCVLRIQFPDRFVLQGIFKPYEQLERVVSWVREFLANPVERFQLFTIPPKKVLPAEETLLELNFVPNAVLHFAYVEENLNTDNHRFIQDKFIDQLTSEEGAHYAVILYRTKVSPT